MAPWENVLCVVHTRSVLQKYVNEQTRVADELLKNYDKRFIPAKPG